MKQVRGDDAFLMGLLVGRLLKEGLVVEPVTQGGFYTDTVDWWTKGLNGLDMKVRLTIDPDGATRDTVVHDDRSA